jgi:hypothetical protein
MSLPQLSVTLSEIWQYATLGGVVLAGVLAFLINVRILRKSRLEHRKLQLEIKRLERELDQAGFLRIVKPATVEEADELIRKRWTQRRFPKTLNRYMCAPTEHEDFLEKRREYVRLQRRLAASVTIDDPQDLSLVPRALVCQGRVLCASEYKNLYFGVRDHATNQLGIDRVHKILNGIWQFERQLGTDTSHGARFTLFVFLSDAEVPVHPEGNVERLLTGPYFAIDVERE